MFCLAYWLTPKRNRNCYLLALFLMFIAAILSIVFAIISLRAGLFSKYSAYLNGSMRGLSFTFGLAFGIIMLLLSILGLCLISRKY